MSKSEPYYERFSQAVRLVKSGRDPLAPYRLRADILLQYGDEELIELTQEERDVLERICIAPAEDDREFLGGFDPRLAAMR